MADVDLKFSDPEARIQIDRDKAGTMGISTRNIAQTLQYGLSGQRMGYFYMNGKQYEILGEINRQQRNKPRTSWDCTSGARTGKWCSWTTSWRLPTARRPQTLPLQPLRIRHRLHRPGRRQNHRTRHRGDGTR